MPPSTPILNAQNISKRFGAVPLFRNISFTIEEGDRIGLIGPNGSGKSTLMRILGGDVDTDDGEVTMRKRARASFVTQDSTFEPGDSVRDVIVAALKRASVPEAEWEGRLRETLGPYQEYQAATATVTR